MPRGHSAEGGRTRSKSKSVSSRALGPGDHVTFHYLEFSGCFRMAFHMEGII